MKIKNKKIRFASLVAVLALAIPLAARALSSLPFHEDFRYADGTSLAGVNSWAIYSTNTPPYGIQDHRYHGWSGILGGTAIASNEQGRVAGVELKRVFGTYTGNPGTTNVVDFDKAPLVTLHYAFEPRTGVVQTTPPTAWSKYGRMYTPARFTLEARGPYYQMMPVARWFVRTNNLISAYNGHRLNRLTHAPLTNRTSMVVQIDYQAKVWSLWLGNQQVITNFALYKTHRNTDMSHNGWFKDYDGLKEINIIDVTSNTVTRADQVRIFEGTRDSCVLPLTETFETRNLATLDGQGKWFAKNVTVSTASARGGTKGGSISSAGECLQIFFDQKTNVWTDLWLRPRASGTGSVTVDAGGEDGVFRITSDGAVYIYNGTTETLVTSVSKTTFSRFTAYTDYSTGRWYLWVNGVVEGSNLAFKRVDPGDSYQQTYISASDSIVSYLDDLSVGTEPLFTIISPPTGLSATVLSTNQINLAWTDTSTDETGFQVERSLTSTTGFSALGTAPANATNYTDTTVGIGMTYYYRVTSTNAEMSSVPSGVASATTPKSTTTVSLDNLLQVYNGTPRAVTTTTAPAGLVVVVTYDGSAVAPTNAGSYAIMATIADAIYQGTTNGTLIVGKGTPTVSTWPTALGLQGYPLSQAPLTGGSASVPGGFSFQAPATIPPLGVSSQAVVFAATDVNNYSNVVGEIAVMVVENTPPSVDAGTNQTVKMLGSTWTPAQITTVAWYDAADAATVMTNSTTVSQWNDKSGNNRHATATAGVQPTYSRSDAKLNSMPSIGINLNDANKYLTTPSMGVRKIYVVSYYDDPDNTFDSWACMVAAADGSPRLSGWSGQSKFQNNGMDTVYKNGSSATNYATTYAVLPMPATIWAVQWTNTFTETWRILSANASYNGWEYGAVGEVIFTDGTEDVATQQKIEGYLAHKWGIASRLFGGHPYKNTAPAGTQQVATANLDGTVYDPEGYPLTTAWTFVSGPATPYFLNSAEVDTVATFTSLGTYTLRLTASDVLTSSNDTCVITVVEGIPPAPTGLSATAISDTRIDLRWTETSTTETGFRIERSLTSGSNFMVIGSAAANATNYTDNTGSPGMTLYYRVTATNTEFSGITSAEASATLKLAGTITLGNLSQTYDGTARVVTTTTEPTNLAVVVTYNGSSVAPTNAGSYAMVATINEALYQGSTNGTLVVAQVTPTVTNWPIASSIAIGQAVSNSVLSGGSASVPGSFGFTSPTTVVLVEGIYTAAVTFVATDSVNYAPVNGTVNMTITLTISYGLPFAENFEARTEGSLHGQNGWVASDTSVQTTNAIGTKAASINSAVGYMEHSFAGLQTLAWTDFVLKAVFYESSPSLPEPVGNAIVYFNAAGHPVAYSNTTPLELTGCTVSTAAWTRVTIKSDYATKKWDLYINTVKVATGLGFYNQDAIGLTGFKVYGASGASVALDELTIGLQPPWPNKGTLIRFNF